MTLGTGASWVALARMLRPQGRKGELLAELFTDFPDRLVGREGLYLAREGFDGGTSEARACSVLSAWLPTGRNEGRVVLALAGVDRIEAAEALAGFELLIGQVDRLPLEDGAAYVSDLVGCTVLDGERAIGTVLDVQFPVTADGRRKLEHASPLLLVQPTSGGEEVMVPFAKDLLRKIDLERKLLHMALPKGLLELSQQTEHADRKD